MNLTENQTLTLASIICDYMSMGNTLTPDELSLAMAIMRSAGTPQNVVEHLWRAHADFVAAEDAADA